MDSIPEIIVSNFPKQFGLYKLKQNDEATSQYLSELRSTGSLIVIYNKTLPIPKYEFGYVTYHNNINEYRINIQFKLVSNKKSYSIIRRDSSSDFTITKDNSNQENIEEIFVPIDSNNLYFPLNLKMMKYLKLVTKTEQIKAFADSTSVASSRGILPNLPKEIKQQEIASFLGGKRRTRRRSKSRKNH